MMELKRLLQNVVTIGHEADATAGVSSVCYAADQCSPGSLFVAIGGLAHDGHNFVGQAIERGARFIVHQKNVIVPEGIVSIKVPDSRRALGVIAKNYFGDPSKGLVLVGITGTSGKTTVSYLLESILTAAGFCCGVLGTVNYRYRGKVLPAPNTTPESYEMQRILREMADAGVTHVIAEVSSHALDLKRVDDCDFDLGIFTNLSPEHLDYHKDMEDYFRAKKRLFAELLPQSKKNRFPKAIINADDFWGRRLLGEIESPAMSYGTDKRNAVVIEREEFSLSGIRAGLMLGGEKVSVVSGLIGRFNLSNILAATTAAHALGIAPQVIEAGIKKLFSVPGRLERVEYPSGFHVFVDYAHKPDALKQVLTNLGQLKQKRILTVFGCGGNRDRAKRPLMGEIATSLSDFTIVTSDNPRKEDPLAIIEEITLGVDERKTRKLSPEHLQFAEREHVFSVIPDRKSAIAAAIGLAGTEDIVLIAGKGHEDYQILGTKKISFDDRLVAAEALALRFSVRESPAISLSDVLEATGGSLMAGCRGNVFYGISTDSRNIRADNLFLALAGEHFDGHAFVQKAVEAGASGAVITDADKIPLDQVSLKASVITVGDTLTALGDLANAYRRRFHIPVIGLTGSSGKTTTKEMLSCILRQERRVLKTEGNLNNLIGLPQTIFRLTPDHQIAVLEMGTNTRGEIKRLTQIAQPDVGLITNVGPAHLAGFGSIEAVREEKGDLFLNMRKSGIAVVNLDDKNICEKADQWSGRRVTFSMSAVADIGVTGIQKNGIGKTTFSLLIGGKAHKVDMQAAGVHNIYNAMAAAAAALACDASAEAIVRGLKAFVPVSGRMEIIRLKNGAYIINDAYNANPASVREALLTLKDLKSGHNAFVFLGDMLELGDAAVEMHRKIGLLLATIGVSAVFLQGDFAPMTAQGAQEAGLSEEQIFFLDDDDKAMGFLKEKLRRGDWVLLKGSRRMKMDRIAARLMEDFGIEQADNRQEDR